MKTNLSIGPWYKIIQAKMDDSYPVAPEIHF